MKLTTQKRLAATILDCSPSRVKFDPKSLNEIKDAITKHDLKELIKDKVIIKEPARGVSRVRARKNAQQRSKGLQKGPGSRRSKRTARITKKDSWIKRVRIQRAFLEELKDKELISAQTYKNLYRKVKGGFFRSKRHIKLYLEEHELGVRR